MRQTGNTQNQGQTQGDEVELAGQRATVLQTRLQDVLGLVATLGHVGRGIVHVHRVLEQLGEVTAHADEDDDGHNDHRTHQQYSLNHLHIGGALHTADEHVGDHNNAHHSNHNGLLGLIVDVKQHCHQ